VTFSFQSTLPLLLRTLLRVHCVLYYVFGSLSIKTRYTSVYSFHTHHFMRSHIKSSITSRPKMSYKATRVNTSTSNCKKSIYNNVSKIYSSKTSCHYKSFCAMFLDVTFKHSNRSAARRNVLRSVRPHDRPHVLQSNDHQTCRRAHCFG